MKIRLDNKFNAFPNKTILGYVGETNARTITFSGLSVSGANSYSMIIDYGDGENYEVNIVDGVYTVDASVLKRPGLVNCQVLAKALSEDGTTYTIVKKSNIFALNIGKSIDPGAIPTYEQATSAVEKLIQINPNANDVLNFTEQIDQNVDDIAELSGSVEELKSDLSQLSEEIDESIEMVAHDLEVVEPINWYNYTNNTYGYGLNSTTGNPYENEHMFYSDYVPSKFGDVWKLYNTSFSAMTLNIWCAYDVNKNFISSSATTDVFEVPENTAFIRFSMLNQYASKNHQLCKNDFVPTSLNEYFKPYFTTGINKIKSQITNWYNATEYGFIPSNTGVDNALALYELINMVDALGGGTIYIPSGIYYVNNENNVTIKASKIRFVGDGMSTILRRTNKYPIFNFVGTTIKVGYFDHCEDVSFENIYFYGYQEFHEDMRAIMVWECVSYFRILNCHFKGQGSHIDFREAFDSKIIATDFDESGRMYKSDGIADATFDVNGEKNLQGCSPTFVMQSSIPSQNDEKQIIENTNQIHFIGCRIESFTDGFLGVVGSGTNSIHFTNCKFESLYTTTPLVMIIGSLTNSTFTNCYFYRPTKLINNKEVSDIPFFEIIGDFIGNIVDGNMSIYVKTEPTILYAPLVNVDGYIFRNNIINVVTNVIAENGEIEVSEDFKFIGLKSEIDMLIKNKINFYIIDRYNGISITKDYMPIINAVPTNGTYRIGEVVQFNVPDADGYMNAICVESGTPGIWKRYGKIES